MTAPDGRWHGEAGRALAAEVVRRLAGGADLNSLGLGQHLGRADLRGMPASGTDIGGPGEIVELRNVRLASLDLSGASLANWRLHDCTVDGCLLEETDCQDWRLWRSLVLRCGLAGAKLLGAAVGTWVDGAANTWREINFKGADFRVGASLVASYVDCDFSAANLEGVHFDQCEFVRCSFAGDIHAVRFDGRGIDDRPPSPPPIELDFRNARLEEVEFIGVDLSGVWLPPDPDLRLIHHYRCSVAAAFELLEHDEEPPAQLLRGVLSNRLQQLQVGTTTADTGLVNLRELRKILGPEVASLADNILQRAQARCVAQASDS